MAKADRPAGPEPVAGGHNADNDDQGLPTFSSRDWVASAAALARAAAGRRDRRRAVRHQHHLPAGRPVRPARPAVRPPTTPAPTTSTSGLDIFEWLDVVDAGDAYCPHGQSARSHRNIESKVTDVLKADAFPIVIGGDHSITYPSATAVAAQVRLGQGRAAALRRARRHRGQHRGQPALARHPDAPADRVRRDPRAQLRPGRAARLLAAAGGLRLDARAGDDLAPDERRLGPRHAAGDRRRHRPGR